MNTPLSTPIRQAKLGISSTKSLPLANEYKKLLNEQYQRLWTKHQQDLDLIDDIRAYVKARLNIERDYTSSLNKLGKQHSNNIAKRFTLLNQCNTSSLNEASKNETQNNNTQIFNESEVADSRLQKRLANNGSEEPEKPCSLYKVWSEHINRLQSTSKNRAEQFEQLLMVVDKLKDIRSHKNIIGKKSLDAHLKRIHEDVVVSIVDVEKARKLYNEDESQARKARANEEKIKKKRSGLLTKFTDLQAKKEKTSAQREATDIQSTQARNDYIMALAAANAHLQNYYQRDLVDFIQTIDDGVLDHCKIFMATLSECDINSLKFSLTNAQYWSKLINLTGSQTTNTLFFDCPQSKCLREASSLAFEPCNNDPIQTISLEHNADYALQHEIDKWFTWFKKECRNLSQLLHQLETLQRAFSEGKKSIEFNGQTIEDLEPKIVDLRQQIRKSEAAKLKAQARLKVIKEGGMQIEEWSAVESEIRADVARAQEEMEARRAKQILHESSSSAVQKSELQQDQKSQENFNYGGYDSRAGVVQLQVSKDSDDSEVGEPMRNLSSVGRSPSNIAQAPEQEPQSSAPSYQGFSDAWGQSNYDAWGGPDQSTSRNLTIKSTQGDSTVPPEPNRYELLEASAQQSSNQINSMTVQSSSPLSAVIDPAQTSPNTYQNQMTEAYKSDYECDYNRTGHSMRSAASSAEPYNQQQQRQIDPFGKSVDEQSDFNQIQQPNEFEQTGQFVEEDSSQSQNDPYKLMNQLVVALYDFDKTNDDDLALKENDVVRVIEINDAHWVKARNSNNEEGFIPSSYVKLLGDEENNAAATANYQQAEFAQDDFSESKMDGAAPAFDSIGASDSATDSKPGQLMCRAVYDYEPEADAHEDDGLPHLALIQGELLRVIDEGEDDGWWLVEKTDSGLRGHVPSMLVEEVDPNAEDDDLEEEEDGDASECSYNGQVPTRAMPSFEPPVLQQLEPEAEIVDQNNNVDQGDNKTSASLVPTSFIIIEPTPEVESRQIEAIGERESEKNVPMDEAIDQRPIITSNEVPPSNVSYSVVNEGFVLEKPIREPHRPTDIKHHETPTIPEGNADEEIAVEESNYHTSKLDQMYNDSPNFEGPTLPSVVIDHSEDQRRLSSSSVETQREVEIQSRSINGGGDTDLNLEPDYGTGDSPSEHEYDTTLWDEADDFSQKIISEAIMLAPGSEEGPSTSFANLL